MPAHTQRPTAAEYNAYYATYTNLVPDGDVLAHMGQQHAELNALLGGISTVKADARPAAGEWTTKQVVQHLIDSERLFAFRALWIARGEQTAQPGMEPNPWAELADTSARTMPDMLSEFGHVRAATIALFTHLTDAAWARSGSASGFPVSVRALAWIIAGHERHHMTSLREKYL
jgi:hypothetical protein